MAPLIEEDAKAWDVPLIIANPKMAIDTIMENAEELE
jgi:hypothetical protein